jgi:hypothetical protein
MFYTEILIAGEIGWFVGIVVGHAINVHRDRAKAKRGGRDL